MAGQIYWPHTHGGRRVFAATSPIQAYKAKSFFKPRRNAAGFESIAALLAAATDPASSPSGQTYPFARQAHHFGSNHNRHNMPARLPPFVRQERHFGANPPNQT